MSRSRHIAVVVFVCLAVGLSGQRTAHAEPGDGIETESLRLRLGIGTTGAANTNLFFQSSDPTLAFLLSVDPSLGIESLDGRKFELVLNWRASYQQYLSTQEAVLGQSGLTTALAGGLHFNRDGNLSLRLEESFTRTNEAPNTASTNSIHRIINRAGAVLGVHPGDRVVQGLLSYHLNSFLYNLENSSLSDLNKNEHQFQLLTKWQFLPRTALALMADYRRINYSNPVRNIGTVQTDNVDSRPLRLRLGINGLLFNRLGVTLNAGYGWAFYVDDTTFRGLLAQAGLNYYLQTDQSSSVYVRYERNFQDSIIGNFFTSHLATAGVANKFLDKRLNIAAEFSADFREYQFNEPIMGAPLPNGGGVVIDSQINDIILIGSLRADYNLRKWATLGAGYQLRTNIADNDAITVATSPTPVDVARDYLQNVVSVYFRATY